MSGTVEPLFETEPGGETGTFYVIKDRCLVCALPVNTAPHLFHFLKYPDKPACSRSCCFLKQPVTLEEVGLAVEAAIGSCVDAVRYCGDNPEVLRIFREQGGAHLCDKLAREDPAIMARVDHRKPLTEEDRKRYEQLVAALPPNPSTEDVAKAIEKILGIPMGDFLDDYLKSKEKPDDPL